MLSPSWEFARRVVTSVSIATVDQMLSLLLRRIWFPPSCVRVVLFSLRPGSAVLVQKYWLASVVSGRHPSLVCLAEVEVGVEAKRSRPLKREVSKSSFEVLVNRQKSIVRRASDGVRCREEGIRLGGGGKNGGVEKVVSRRRRGCNWGSGRRMVDRARGAQN